MHRSPVILAAAGCLLLGCAATPLPVDDDAFVTEAELVRPAGEYRSQLVRSTVREEAIELLEGFAFDEVAELRANAIEGLGAAPRRVEPIVRVALADPNPGVRFAAAMTAGRLRLRDSAAHVRPLLRARDPRVQMAAIYALVRLGEPVDRTPLARHLLDDSRPSVRAQAAFVLGELGDPSAAPLLRDVASPPTPRPAEAQELPPSAPPPTIDETLLRLQVAEALVKLGDDEVRSVMHSALYPKRRDDFEAAVLACQILGELEDRSAITQLVELVERTAPDAPSGGDAREIEFINPPQLRLAAATALAKMGQRDGVYVADMYVRDPDPVLRAQTAFLYAAGGKSLDLAKLHHLMRDDPAPPVRLAAAAGILRAVGDRG